MVLEPAGEVHLGGLDGGMNVTVECCDRRAADGRAVLNWAGRDFAEEAAPFATPRRPAGPLRQPAPCLGKRQRRHGRRGLLPRIPELSVLVLDRGRTQPGERHAAHARAGTRLRVGQVAGDRFAYCLKDR